MFSSLTSVYTFDHRSCTDYYCASLLSLSSSPPSLPLPLFLPLSLPLSLFPPLSLFFFCPPPPHQYLGLPNDVDWRCDKLKKLDLSHNRLRALPDTFQDLRRMVALNVSYNHLKEIPQSCSWGCVNLVSQLYMYMYMYMLLMNKTSISFSHSRISPN